MIRYLLSRIGCLILLSGIIVLIIGGAVLQSGGPAFEVIVIGIGLLIIGFLLWNKLRTKSRRSTRFSMFRNPDQEDDQENDDGWN
jgi:cell division protein FtsW (lipid II flippase)